MKTKLLIGLLVFLCSGAVVVLMIPRPHQITAVDDASATVPISNAKEDTALAVPVGQPPYSPAVLDIIGDNSFDVRRSAVDRLERNLTPSESEALWAFVQQQRPKQISITRWHTLVNDILNSLRAQFQPLPGLDQKLAQMFRNPEFNAVLRDYALQHLSLLHWKCGREREELYPEYFVECR
jgi:hypothetical protein